MSFKYRVKKYQDEEGEYSDYLPCNKYSILEIIEANWTDNRPNGLQVISILNDFGQSLLLEHFGKDVFDVYYLPTVESYHFHKMSKQELIYHCLDLFMSNEIGELESSLNKTVKDNKFIRKEFFFIDHDYKMTEQREMKELGRFLLFGVPYGITFLGIGFMMAFYGGLALMFSIFLIAIGTYAWLPGLLLHSQYKKDAIGLTVRVTKGSKQIIVNSNGSKRILEKADIVSLIKVQNPTYRNPWSDYGYAEIKFKSGQIINLSNLMVDQLFLLDKFTNDNIDAKTLNKLIPRLRNKSNLV